MLCGQKRQWSPYLPFTGYLISFCGLRDLSETNHRRRATVLPCHHATAGFHVCGCRDEHPWTTDHSNGTVRKYCPPLATSSDLPWGGGEKGSAYTVTQVEIRTIGSCRAGQYCSHAYRTLLSPPSLLAPFPPHLPTPARPSCPVLSPSC